MNYVYILYNTSSGKFYKGQTQDVGARLKRHQTGQSEFTSKTQGWQLLWSKEMPDRSAAVLLENKIKNLNCSRLCVFIQKYSENIVDVALLETILERAKEGK